MTNRGVKLAVAASLALVAGLVAFALPGPAEDTPPRSQRAGADAPSYTDDIQPIFNKRCVACHGCLGSPCNVKLTSYRGVERGGFAIRSRATTTGSRRRRS